MTSGKAAFGIILGFHHVVTVPQQRSDWSQLCHVSVDSLWCCSTAASQHQHRERQQHSLHFQSEWWASFFKLLVQSVCMCAYSDRPSICILFAFDIRVRSFCFTSHICLGEGVRVQYAVGAFLWQRHQTLVKHSDHALFCVSFQIRSNLTVNNVSLETPANATISKCSELCFWPHSVTGWIDH